MRKSLLAAAVTGVFSCPALVMAEEPASPHTLTGNMSIVSDYRFRGITQTFEKPAIQGGIDYSHASGIYLGNWNSNVSEGAGFPEGNLEMDFYGGYKTSFGDVGIDLGAIYYYYPGSDYNLTRSGALINPKTLNAHTGEVSNTEVYIGGSWKFISLKYYYAVSDYFSIPDTDGTSYIDLSASYDLGGGWGINGHVGFLSVDDIHAGTDASDADYTDYKLGVTKALGSWVVAASYIGTNAKGDCNPANLGFYCFTKAIPFGSTSTRDAGDDTVVVSLSKSF